ncbi:ribonuclease P protein subunit p38 [Engraulis encrasicolus]|uniref:ribonuclease P protein subunit p38 n=1 Tax=Engraulis encrasicolus TaxID=184585 RepID=UPI002FD08D67
MAAPMKAGKKSKKKSIPTKTSLNSPFDYRWVSVSNDVMDFIHSTLKDRFSDIGLQKREVKVFRSRCKKLGTLVENREPSPAKMDVVQPTPADPTDQGWTDAKARKQLAIGINEVTKGLERNELCLVLVCNSVKPKHMTQHLIPLSKTRSVPACQVPRLSENLAAALGLKCVLALGFKRDAPAFKDTVSAIVPKVPSVDVSWLSTPEQKAGESLERREDKAVEEQEQTRGLKRKLEETPPGTPVPPSSGLQPLKVKRIVPNPSKVRKPKKQKVKK